MPAVRPQVAVPTVWLVNLVQIARGVEQSRECWSLRDSTGEPGQVINQSSSGVPAA